MDTSFLGEASHSRRPPSLYTPQEGHVYIFDTTVSIFALESVSIKRGSDAPKTLWCRGWCQLLQQKSWPIMNNAMAENPDLFVPKMEQAIQTTPSRTTQEATKALIMKGSLE